MESIYIETTIPSYVAARPTNDIIKMSHQIQTRNFWENERQKYDLYISQFVYDECAKGDAQAASRRLNLIEDIKYLPVTDEVIKLAPVYKELLQIPDKAKLDSFHLAVAVIGKMDYILTWNFTHMGIESYSKLLKYNEDKGYKTPLLVTPEYLMNQEDDNDV